MGKTILFEKSSTAETTETTETTETGVSIWKLIKNLLVKFLLVTHLAEEKKEEEVKEETEKMKEEEEMSKRDVDTMRKIVSSISQKDFVTLCQTVYGEARGEKRPGRMGVAHSILNRVEKQSWMGKNVHEVCLKPYQFSCWLESDPNYTKLLNLSWQEAYSLGIYDDVQIALLRWAEGHDSVCGATHYHADYVSPFWAEGKTPCKIIGRHLFYDDIE